MVRYGYGVRAPLCRPIFGRALSSRRVHVAMCVVFTCGTLLASGHFTLRTIYRSGSGVTAGDGTDLWFPNWSQVTSCPERFLFDGVRLINVQHPLAFTRCIGESLLQVLPMYFFFAVCCWFGLLHVGQTHVSARRLRGV